MDKQTALERAHPDDKMRIAKMTIEKTIQFYEQAIKDEKAKALKLLRECVPYLEVSKSGGSLINKVDDLIQRIGEYAIREGK